MSRAQSCATAFNRLCAAESRVKLTRAKRILIATLKPISVAIIPLPTSFGVEGSLVESGVLLTKLGNLRVDGVGGSAHGRFESDP